MDVIKEWLANPVLFALAALFFYFGKRLFDHIFDFMVKKTKTEYVTLEEYEEYIEKTKKDFEDYVKETKKDMERTCKANMDACSVHRHESIAWLEPTMKKILKQNVQIKKFMHLVGSKLELDEGILRNLINGDADIFDID